MKAKMRNIGCDVIKGIIIIVLVLQAGLVSAYTPEQQTTLDVINLSFQLGIAYEKASQGQNVTEFNTLVDIYNAWIREHFGEDVNLLMQKMNDTAPLEVSPETNETTPLAIYPETNANSPVEVSSETNANSPVEVSSETSDNRSLPVSLDPLVAGHGLKDPFEPGSELSQFGKQWVYDFFEKPKYDF